jgi:hypothetical protein
MHPTVRLWRNLHLNTKLRNLGVRPGPYWVSPRAVSWVWGCRPPSLIVLSSISHRLFQEPCMLRGHLAGSFPPILHPSPPIFKPFFHLYFPHEAEQTKQRKHYTATGPPLPLLPSTLSPPLLVVLASLLPAPGWPTSPYLSSPLSPTPSFLPNLHATPLLLSPLFFISGVASPRLPFPSTIWTLIPPLLMTSAQVFFAEGVVGFGWWVFFPLPPVFIFGVFFAVVAARSLMAFSFLLFFHASFPSTVFHPSFATRAVVVGVSGRVVS